MATLDGLSGPPVVIGAGVAGMFAALKLAPMPVVLVSKALLGAESSSDLAQGGLAASLGSDDDPELHSADTLAAGAGLSDVAVTRRITRAAPAAIETLVRLGAKFDRDSVGRIALGLEAAHSRHRIVHAAGDRTGHELVHTLAAAVRATPSIEVLEGFEARRLVVQDGRVAGVLLAHAEHAVALATNRVLLATGGIGALFTDTTNSDGCFGQGLALAARAGATLANLEFVQFHPTALAVVRRPAPLVSEAVRGEGAVLVDETGARFLAGEPGAELATRDVVARGIWRHLAAGHQVYLDARRRPGALFAKRFPAITAFCAAAGIDPVRDLIPVRPAAHYHMGGVAVDREGRSSVAGLWACGEVACTGLHGANRLASNSLIEALICAEWVAASMGGASAAPTSRLPAMALPPHTDPAAVRSTISRGLGVERDGESLRATIRTLLPLARGSAAAADPALVGLMLGIAAWRRCESRGAHWRTDFQKPVPGFAQASRLSLAEALETTAGPVDQPVAPLVARSA
ncbi:MAG: L-aspartate oxidase [Gammaproteobacteria bacterium]